MQIYVAAPTPCRRGLLGTAAARPARLPMSTAALRCLAPRGPAMASAAVSPAGVLGLLLVSALPGVLGDRPSPDLRAHPGTSEGCWGEAGTARGPSPVDPPLPSSAGDLAQVCPKAAEARRPPPPKDQQERARALPLGALYTAAVVAFVLYKCLQVREEPWWGCLGPEYSLGALGYQGQENLPVVP